MAGTLDRAVPKVKAGQRGRPAEGSCQPLRQLNHVEADVLESTAGQCWSQLQAEPARAGMTSAAIGGWIMRNAHVEEETRQRAHGHRDTCEANCHHTHLRHRPPICGAQKVKYSTNAVLSELVHVPVKESEFDLNSPLPITRCASGFHNDCVPRPTGHQHQLYAEDRALTGEHSPAATNTQDRPTLGPGRASAAQYRSQKVVREDADARHRDPHGDAATTGLWRDRWCRPLPR
eukprot:scaffold4264_cov116-Isochrysis_galbana.AAC.9